MNSKTKRVRRQSFTLVEVIAVLLVIAILAAVAAPKFVSMAAEARNGVAKAGINEAKASLSVAYAKAYLGLEGASNPTASEVITAAAFTYEGVTSNVAFGDIIVTVTGTNDTTVTLTAVSVRGTPVTGVTDTWTVPTQ
jgi:MSHA pilin protein MshA